MSGSWNKATVTQLPYLPPEVWYHILRAATTVPGALEPDIYDPSDQPAQVCAAKHQKLLRQSLITKRYIVRVCKQWHALGTPLLYEALTVGLSRAMSSLCTTLVESNRRADHTPCGYRSLGWHTKRLDIAIRESRLAERDASSLFDNITNVIDCLPRLSIAIFYFANTHGNSPYLPATMIEALANTCGPSLRCLYYFGTVWHLQKHLNMVLQAAPRLRVLHDLSKSVNVPIPYMPDLVSLSINSFSGIAPSNLPSIREIRYFPDVANRDQDFFVGQIGQRLTVVHLDMIWSIVQLQQGLNVLIKHCPNIIRLVLALDSWGSSLHLPHNEDLILPPTPYLGLRCSRRPQPTSHEYRSLFETLSRTKGPTLKAVGLSDPITVKDLVTRHAHDLSEGLKAIRHCTFDLVDDEGRQFQ